MRRPFLSSEDSLAYFYCSRTSSDTRQRDIQAILLSILRQLAAPLPGLPLKGPVILTYDRETARGSQKAQLSTDEVVNLLNELIIHHYESVILVVDALDECDAGQRSQLLDILIKLTFNPKTVVKTLISSRNDPDIAECLSSVPSLTVTATDNAADIMKFVKKEINQRLLRGRASKRIRERVEENLNAKANGSFRWTTLQVDSLCDPDRVFLEGDVEYLLSKLPQTLEETYAGIMQGLDDLPSPSRVGIKNVLRLLLCAEYPMSVVQILEAITTLTDSKHTTWDEDTILKVAHGLIGLDRWKQIFVFTHLSVREFLEDKPEFSGEQAHAIAAEACLKVYFSWNSAIPSPAMPVPVLSSVFANSKFRWYALSHLGRHVWKSGMLRQEAKLGNLLKKFLLDEDCNGAFQQWNRDCFKVHNELAPETRQERRTCQSRPGTPLFLMCVYGFKDFLEPLVARNSSALSAENFYGSRPLEVAADSGHYEVMESLHQAANSMCPSSIREGSWLAMAARSANINVWRFAVKHIPRESLKKIEVFKKGTVNAVQNSLCGKEVVKCLLDIWATNINEDLLAIILGRCASLEILDVILAHGPAVFTEAALEQAVVNPYICVDLTQMVLSKSERLYVSQSCILLAVCGSKNSASSKLAVLTALLDHLHRCEVTEEMVYNVIKFYNDKDVACLDLLLQRYSADRIPEDWLVAAAGNKYGGPATLHYLLDSALEHSITQQVLQSALLNILKADQSLQILLARPECPPLFEESLYVMTKAWSGYERLLPMALNACRSVHVTDYMIQAYAANRSDIEMGHIIDLPRAFPISRGAVWASTKNPFHAAKILARLLSLKSGFELEVSEELVIQALTNGPMATQLLAILTGQCSALPVTESTLIAAAEHDRDGTATFGFLLQDESSRQSLLTNNVLLAAIRGHNVEFVECFWRHRPDFKVNEEMLVAAIHERSTNNAILKRLLSQPNRCSISTSMLEAIPEAEPGQANDSIHELLLEQPEISVLPDKEEKHLDQGEAATLDAILKVLYSKPTGQERCSFRPCTEKLAMLLSNYNGPDLDSSQLLEFAAGREDGKFFVQYLLSRFPGVVITQRALVVAAANTKALLSLLTLLLEHFDGPINSEILQAAAGNSFRGTESVELLLSYCPANYEVEANVISTALRNEFCSHSLLELFVKRKPNLVITREMVDVAPENTVTGGKILYTFLKDSLITDSENVQTLVLEKMKTVGNGLRDFLFMAACYGDTDVLKLLISYGASLSEISGELGTALNVAVYAYQAEIVEILLEQGSDPQSNSKLYGTPLHTACQHGDVRVIGSLAKYNVEIDQPTQMGRTELHVAVREGDLDVTSKLLSLGASTSKKDHQGMTAMHHATFYTKSTFCIYRLTESGAPVNQEDSQRWTPLHWAAKTGALEAVTELLNAGADKTKTEASGKMPFQIAMICGNIHLRPVLFVPDTPDLDNESVGEVHQNIVCDACDLVSLA